MVTAAPARSPGYGWTHRLHLYWRALLLARLMGGRGSLRQQGSLPLLAFLPQALTLLSSFALGQGSAVAGLAMILRLVAAVWSLVILVCVLATANGFGRGQAAKVLLVTATAALAVAALAALLVDPLGGPVLSRLLG